MKYQTKTDLFLRASAALVLALVLQSTVLAEMATPSEGKTKMESQMTARCQEMKDKKQKMNEDIKAQDAVLAEQLAKMNSAPQDKKMGEMAAVVNIMAEQRIAMDARKAVMEEAMMKHMMEHMQKGKESMSRCPMMKGMMDAVDASTSTHKMPPMDQKSR